MQGPYMGCASGKRSSALGSCFGVIVDRTREAQCRCNIEENRQVTRAAEQEAIFVLAELETYLETKRRIQICTLQA